MPENFQRKESLSRKVCFQLFVDEANGIFAGVVAEIKNLMLVVRFIVLFLAFPPYSLSNPKLSWDFLVEDSLYNQQNYIH